MQFRKLLRGRQANRRGHASASTILTLSGKTGLHRQVIYQLKRALNGYCGNKSLYESVKILTKNQYYVNIIKIIIKLEEKHFSLWSGICATWG